MPQWVLSYMERRVIEKLRELQRNSRGFKLILYGFRNPQGKQIIDMEPIPKIRLEDQEPLSAAIDD